jgi:hypothetical protein
MPRFLVNKYPCRRCGEPTDVQSRRDIEHACCERCAKLSSVCSSANWQNRRRAEEWQKSNEQPDTPEEFLRFLGGAARAIEYAAASAERSIHAAHLHDKVQHAHDFALMARSQFEWIVGLVETITPYTEAFVKSKPPLAALVVSNEAPETTPSATPARPALRLVAAATHPEQEDGKKP